jgi:protein-L-isoaspartate(D-aspartate) O-methyltransferase
MSSDPRTTNLISDLRHDGIRDERVLDAIANIPREHFVDAPFAHTAYENTALPIACGQTISQPYVVAYMTEALALEPKHRVLEIGTGSGYQAAVLSQLCRRVYTIERHRPLSQEADKRFRALKLDNVVTKVADGHLGWPEQAPFDRILLTAATAEVPQTLLDQLVVGGVLVAPIGPPPDPDPLRRTESFSQLLTKMIRTETGFEQQRLIPVVFVPMLAGVPGAGGASNDERRKP